MTRSLRSLLALAVVAAVCLATRTWERAAEIGYGVAAFCKTIGRHVVDVLAPTADSDRAPAVRFVQAKAFVQRIIRRERLQMTSGWRMCPSI